MRMVRAFMHGRSHSPPSPLQQESKLLVFGLSCVRQKEQETTDQSDAKEKFPSDLLYRQSQSMAQFTVFVSHQLNRRYVGTRSTALTTILQGLQSVRT
jgi:hypothetical protein